MGKKAVANKDQVRMVLQLRGNCWRQAEIAGMVGIPVALVGRILEKGEGWANGELGEGPIGIEGLPFPVRKKK